MEDETKKPLGEDENAGENDDELFDEIYTLTDEDGKASEFKLIGSCECDGHLYRAMIPLKENGEEDGDEYVVLRSEKDENGDESLVTIDDDEEFDRIADLFDDEFADVYYEENNGEDAPKS